MRGQNDSWTTEESTDYMLRISDLCYKVESSSSSPSERNKVEIRTNSSTRLVPTAKFLFKYKSIVTNI